MQIVRLLSGQESFRHAILPDHSAIKFLSKEDLRNTMQSKHYELQASPVRMEHSLHVQLYLVRDVRKTTSQFVL